MRDLIKNFLDVNELDYKIETGINSGFKILLNNKKIYIDICSFCDFQLNLYSRCNVKIIDLNNSIEKTEYRIISASDIKCLQFVKDIILNEVDDD